MRFRNIEVSGISTIVFNREIKWELDKGLNKWATFQGDMDCLIPDDTMPHEEMMRIVNLLKLNRRYRMWVHADTLNIVRRGK